MGKLGKYELVQEGLGDAIIHKEKHRVEFKGTIFRCVSDLPVDEPLCEMIEEFGIPIIRLKGKNYKIRYVARKHLEVKLHIKAPRFRYHEKKTIWIHPKEALTEREYKAQRLGATQLPLTFHPSLPILYSIGDAIQILSKLQTEKERAKLIRRLIIKLEELQEKLNEKDKEDINDRKLLLEQFDIACYNWIKEHGIDYWHGYKMLWDNELWQMVIGIHYKIRQLLGLPVPKKENAGLHHSDRPYRIVYPHVATKGQIVDNRWDHEDTRQKRFI